MKRAINSNKEDVLEQFPGMFTWEWELNNNSVKYSNRVVDVTGYSGEEINRLNQKWQSLIVQKDLHNYLRTIDEYEEDTLKEFIILDYRIVKKDGSLIDVSERVKILRDKNGKPLKKLGLVCDVSKYIKEIQQLKEKNEQLETLNSSKDRFLQILSHDLRAPFTSILGFSEIILNETKLSEKDKAEYVKFIYDSSNNQLQLVNHLFDWAQIQTGRFKMEIQRLHAQSIVHNCVSYLTENIIRKNIIVNVRIPDSFYINADERLVTKLFMNLISNAIKYSYENESVEISANIYSENFIEFIIKDKGVGISESNYEKIFDIGKIFTTEGTRGEKGSGLGLMLSKQIVEKHGGNLWFFSAEAKGSEFHFTLPLASTYALIVLEEKEKLNELRHGILNSYPKLKILEAENSFEALEIISAKSPSLIIIEHNLPLMNGLQFINAVREKYKHTRIPFIVFIDSDSADLIRAYQDYNVKILKQKPALSESLLDKIEALIYS